MSKFSLINSINDPSQVNEIFSFLSKKPAQNPAPQAKEDEEESSVSSDLPLMHQFVDSIKDAPSGKNRYILRMSTTDLKQHYLKSGVGGKSFIESLDPKILSSFGTLQARIQLMFNDYDAKKLLSKNPKFDAIVLLDVPTSFTNDLKTAWSGAEDINAVRDILIRMMNHRYYVMTLSSSRLTKLIGKISAKWQDTEELSKVFDPSIVISYPNSSEFASIANAFVEGAEADDSRESEAKAKAAEDRAAGVDTAEVVDDNADSDADDEQKDTTAGAPPSKEIKIGKMELPEKAKLARMLLGRLRAELAGKGIQQSAIDTINKALSQME